MIILVFIQLQFWNIFSDKFLAFKTPLGPRYDNDIPEANRFQLPMLFAYLQSLKVSLILFMSCSMIIFISWIWNKQVWWGFDSNPHACKPPEYKNLETSRNLQWQPAEQCQQQWRASKGCGIKAVLFFTKYSIFIVDVKSGRFTYQSGRAGDEARKRIVSRQKQESWHHWTSKFGMHNSSSDRGVSPWLQNHCERPILIV